MRIRKFHPWIILLFWCGVAHAQSSAGQRGIILGDLDRSVSACTDFFEFSNGKWRAENPIPPSMSRWSRRWAVGEQTKDQLREILEAAAKTNAPKGSIEQLTGDLYAACMDESTIDKLGIKPIEPMLREIDGMKDTRDVERMIGKLHAIDVSVAFRFSGRSDVHDPSSVIAQIGASGLRMPDRDYYLKKEPRFEEARQKYVAYVQKLFELSGRDTAQAKSAAAAVMRVETQFAESSLDVVALRSPKNTDHKMSFAEMQKLAPRFDWVKYYAAAGVQPADLNVSQPKFLREFDRQLGATSLADWKSYLTWQLLDSAARSLSSDMVREHFNFHQAFLAGAREMKPRWKRCVESTDDLLGEALGRKYVEKYFPPAAKRRMEELVKNLRLALQERIEGLDWMSAETKRRALEKLSTFNPKIGYPDHWKDYSAVPIRRGAFWESSVAARRFDVQDSLGTINKPVDRGRWGMTPPTSNAYYSPPLNEIVFPAGILQPPAFSMDVTDAVNYGSIGVVIGHEISHGFDDQGSQFDAQGRLNNWWTEEDLKKFQDRAACVAKQFDGYFIEPGLHHNGRLVLGESIGDFAGAKIAYRAFQISQRGKPPAPTIDGFTPDQQFFIAWGQFRGDAERPEAARTTVQRDPHPIGKYRVIGPLSNLPEFQQAFSCKADAPMVRPPSERCEIW